MDRVDQLRTDLRAGESASVEFKTSLSDTRKIVETIAAMATIGGGRIYVGVRDTGEVCGVHLGKGAIEQFVQRVLTATDPRVYIDAETLGVDGCSVLSIVAPPGDGPNLAYGRAFYRSGPSTVAMSRDEYERRLLDRLRESGGYELKVVVGGEADAIDADSVQTFRRRAEGRLPRQAMSESDAQLLRRLHLHRPGGLTVAAALLFGVAPQGPLPQAVIRARSERGGSTRSAEVGGTLCQQIERAVAFVEQHTSVRVDRSAVARIDTPELPAAAVREAVANAVAHRDYRSTAPTQLVLTETGLRIWNPGHLPSPLTVEDLYRTHPSIPPNPFIARVLHLAGYIEEWGTGTTRIVQSMRDAGHPDPAFETTGGSGVEVYLPFSNQPPTVLMVRLQQAQRELPAGTWFRSRDYAEANGVSKRTAANDLVELERIGLACRSGTGRATRWRWE